MTEMHAIPELWLEIIDYLRGSANSLFSALNAHDADHLEDDEEFLRELDDAIFTCEECGWWCEADEKDADREEDGEAVCSDCASIT